MQPYSSLGLHISETDMYALMEEQIIDFVASKFVEFDEEQLLNHDYMA